MRERKDLRRKKAMYGKVLCWQWGDSERHEVADLFNVSFDVQC